MVRDTLVENALWPATWWGETHWHDLASRHPQVIDYFFGGGRDRVAQRSRALQLAILDPTQPLMSMDVAASLSVMMAALNRDDPHYRYDLMTSPTPPTARSHLIAAMAQTQQLADGGYVADPTVAEAQVLASRRDPGQHFD